MRAAACSAIYAYREELEGAVEGGPVVHGSELRQVAMLLGLDLGTSSMKAVVMDADGRMLAVSEAAYPVSAPRPGWAETDPDAWWGAAVAAARAIPERLRRGVAAIGLSGQMHSTVLCTAAGVPVRPAVLWSDTRSRTALGGYRALSEGERRRLGNPLVAGMTGPTLLWLAEHEPRGLESARWALLPKDWLRLRLTGLPGTDPSDGSATLLYDIAADGWAEEVVRRLGIPLRLLPPIQASHLPAGELRHGAASALGLAPGIPVVAGAGDTAAAAYGSGLVRPGDAQLSVGTGAQIVVIGAPERADPDPVVHLFRAAVPGQRYAMAAMQNAGLALRWVCDVLDLSWEELYGSFDPGRVPQGVVFLPYLSGERTPILDAGVRAALAGVALAIRDGFGALVAAGHAVDALRLTGGGARDAGFVQLLADLIGVPLLLTDTPRASAVGAALLALAGVSGDDPVGIAQRVPSPVRAEVLPGERSAELASLVSRFEAVKERLLPRRGD